MQSFNLFFYHFSAFRTGSAFIFALVTAYILCDVGVYFLGELASTDRVEDLNQASLIKPGM